MGYCLPAASNRSGPNSYCDVDLQRLEQIVLDLSRMRKSARQRVLSAVLALLLLPCSFVSAGAEHAHAGSNQPADHDARPHIHVGHAGHSHHHDSGGNHSHSPQSETNSEEDEHDSDAVYLPSEISATLNKSVRPRDDDRVTGTAAIDLSLSTTPFVNASERAFSPDEFGPACPLYLALRGLRI
jgi:hypothetical protein